MAAFVVIYEECIGMKHLTGKYLLVLVALAALVLVVLLGNLGIGRIEASGSPQPMYQAISDYFQQGYTITIWPRVPVLKTGNYYAIHLQDIGSEYYLTRLGTDVLCFQMTKGGSVPVCVPFSSIDFFTYTK